MCSAAHPFWPSPQRERERIARRDACFRRRSLRNDLWLRDRPGTLAVGADCGDAEPEAGSGGKARYGEGRLCRHSMMVPGSRGWGIGAHLDYVARGLDH